MTFLRLNLLLFILAALSSNLVFAADEPAYRKDLVRITRERLPMDPRVAVLCVDVLGPHSVAEVDIFANQTVIAYRKANPDQFSYPVGSKFLKEKFTAGAKSPGEISDWNFELFSLPDMKPIVPKRAAACVDCHEKYSKRGFVSDEGEKALRDFLKPEEIITPSLP